MKARPGSVLDRYLRARREWPMWESAIRETVYAELTERHGADAVHRHRHQVAAVLDRAPGGLVQYVWFFLDDDRAEYDMIEDGTKVVLGEVWWGAPAEYGMRLPRIVAQEAQAEGKWRDDARCWLARVGDRIRAFELGSEALDWVQKTARGQRAP